MPQNKFRSQQPEEPTSAWSGAIPTTVQWGVYARQSSQAQLVNNTESTEMQTEDLIVWLTAKGVPEASISLFDADLGLSGRLRIDQRSDLQRLVSEIEADKIKAVLVYQVSRLFRDETGVQYNVFADVCKQHNCIVVTADGMIFNFRIPMCMKMFRMLAEMAADFLNQQVGLLHAARLRRARKGLYAGLGPVPSGYRVDEDKHSPTYKKIVLLPSHQEIVRKLYYRFYELGVENKSQFFRELDELPYIFPEYPLDIDKATKGSNRKRKVEGGYHMSRYAVEHMLCNPANIGWWIVRGEIISKENHEPILAPEEQYLFWYAFEHLSHYTTDGEVNAKRHITDGYRYEQRTRHYGVAGLLKYRVTAPQGEVYVHWNKGRAGYKIMIDPSRVMRRSDIEIDVADIDTPFCEAFFDKLEHTHDFDHYRQWIDAEYGKQQNEIKSLEAQLAHNATRQEAAEDEILDLRVAVKEEKISEKDAAPQIERLRSRIVVLEQSRKQIEEKLSQISDRDKLEKAERTMRVYKSFHEELAVLKEEWHKKPMDRKVEFVNLLVQNVTLTIEAPRWIRMDIQWAYPLWEAETHYIYRVRGKTPKWTEEEKDILRTMYPDATVTEILQALPNRSWSSITMAAYQVLHVKRNIREKNTIPFGWSDSWQDYQFKLWLDKEGKLMKSQSNKSVKTE